MLLAWGLKITRQGNSREAVSLFKKTGWAGISLPVPQDIKVKALSLADEGCSQILIGLPAADEPCLSILCNKDFGRHKARIVA